MQCRKSISKFFIILVAVTLLVTIVSFKPKNNQTTPIIIFSEYGVTIRSVNKLNDTLFYNKSSKEDFKIVFYDTRGACYLERYLDKKLYQQGLYINSLDTLKKYVSGRGLNGNQSVITVQSYFEPLKNGDWVTYQGKKRIKETYLAGILQK